ncbi:hypothetical protein MIND_00486300 [Mycena indigotica]|uniref:Uncharacterized protein n=1 Tax=Mycena indigotica TaxID=2126181 RepID=A0A8H6SWY7_9AGAR|nr:uncharacterized protein MIND_00486300 [Mycena indigotica]KAF7306936.1 hypothetical protein MIND_00486300 [Mycena indigotica]
MPSFARSLLFALYATALLALTGFSPASTALASPLRGSTTVTNSSNSNLAVRVATKPKNAQLAASSSSPKSNEVEQRIRGYADTAKQHATTLKQLAKQSKTHARRAADLAFQQQCVESATGFRDNYSEFKEYVSGMRGAGNQCYDETNGLEQALHDIVNANKDALRSIYVMVDNIPGLGPVLGPIVYEIKCIIDDILNLTRVTVDCLVNYVVDLLDQLGLGGVLESLCNLSVSLLGAALGKLLCL